MHIALIGNGAISGFVQNGLRGGNVKLGAFVVRPGRVADMRRRTPPQVDVVSSVDELSSHIGHVVDCAGHAALAEHGPTALRAGKCLTTVSLGALANPDVYADLRNAALDGGSRLYLASGAIGALDALRAARRGQLRRVTYTGRKPLAGWRGSPAEEVIDFGNPPATAVTHFSGTARDAALRYPKNANVAAAVALSGLGFDCTEVQLVADPDATSNIHEIHAQGDFGTLEFRVSGAGLPDNPRTSALAALSVLAAIVDGQEPIAF
ncbi:aspartate dehydrogenase (plasmid) [Rhodobacteraceae bacterium SC52]|nr:aspartate dehydrogenase [Rhodobacteraceae bacterium SC52]